MYLSSLVGGPRSNSTNEGPCDHCEDPISVHEVVEELRLVLKVCACSVFLEYDPSLGEGNAACRICPAVDTADLESHEREFSAKIPHVHVLPVAPEVGRKTLRNVLSHSVYDPLLQEYEDNLEDLHEGLEGRKGDWDEVWKIALTLRDAADHLEVLHTPPTGPCASR